MNQKNQTTVLICDDHSIVRSGLRLLLEAEADIRVVGEATNGQEAVQETKRLRPHVALLDFAMPLLNGLEAARQIVKDFSGTKVLMLSGYSDDQHVRHAVEAGVTGYLMKETAWHDLVRAVREVAQGNAFFSPSICHRLLTQWRGAFVNANQANPDYTNLTRRQTEVLQLIAEGYPTKQIAAVLSLKTKTVEKHRQSLMSSLGMHNIAALTRYAISSGIIESGRVPILRVMAA
jgi:DNA-binding NarL/FixJ family response regulator